MSNWWVHPTLGHDSGGSALGTEANPFATFASLISGTGHASLKLMAGDSINLYEGVTYTEKLFVDGGQVLGRDITDVTLNGNNATMTQRIGNTGDYFPVVSVGPSGWVVQDLNAYMLPALADGGGGGDFRDLKNAPSGTSVISIWGGTIRRCLIDGPDTATISDYAGASNVALNASTYPFSRLIVQDCIMYPREQAIAAYVDPSTGGWRMERCKVTFKQWETCESWITATNSVENTMINCTVDQIDHRADSVRCFYVGLNTAEICLIDSIIRVRASGAAQLVTGLMGVNTIHVTLNLFRAINCDITTPADISYGLGDSLLTVAKSDIVDTKFTRYPVAGDGVTLNWPETRKGGKPRVGIVPQRRIA